MPSLPHQVRITVHNFHSDEVEGATVLLTHDSGTLTGTTNKNGYLILNLGDLSSWTTGDDLTITITKAKVGTKTLSTTISSGGGQNHTLRLEEVFTYTTETEPKGRPLVKAILVNPNAEDYSEEFPLPVTDRTLPENYDIEWTITRTDGQPDKETVTIMGVDYERTFTYNSNNILIKRTKWTRK